MLWVTSNRVPSPVTWINPSHRLPKLLCQGADRSRLYRRPPASLNSNMKNRPEISPKCPQGGREGLRILLKRRASINRKANLLKCSNLMKTPLAFYTALHRNPGVLGIHRRLWKGMLFVGGSYRALIGILPFWGFRTTGFESSWTSKRTHNTDAKTLCIGISAFFWVPWRSRHCSGRNKYQYHVEVLC